MLDLGYKNIKILEIIQNKFWLMEICTKVLK